MPIEVWIWISIAVVLGALVQGSVGFGMNTIVAPLIGILRPDLLPGGIILLGVTMSITVLVHSHEHLELKPLRWAILGRLPGTVTGVAIVVIATQNQLGIACGLTVLFAVGVSASGRQFTPTPRNLMLGGYVSGVMGASTGIGGPPIALVLMSEGPQTMKATLSAFLTIGTTLAAVLLAATGQLSLDHVSQIATLAPALILGTLVSRRIGQHLSPQRARAIVLGISSVGALTLLAKSISSAL